MGGKGSKGNKSSSKGDSKSPIIQQRKKGVHDEDGVRSEQEDGEHEERELKSPKKSKRRITKVFSKKFTKSKSRGTTSARGLRDEGGGDGSGSGGAVAPATLRRANTIGTLPTPRSNTPDPAPTPYFHQNPSLSNLPPPPLPPSSSSTPSTTTPAPAAVPAPASTHAPADDGVSRLNKDSAIKTEEESEVDSEDEGYEAPRLVVDEHQYPPTQVLPSSLLINDLCFLSPACADLSAVQTTHLSR